MDSIIYNLHWGRIETFDPETKECNTFDLGSRGFRAMLMDEFEKIWLVRRNPKLKTSLNFEFGYLDVNNKYKLLNKNLQFPYSINLTPCGKIQVNCENNIFFIDRSSGQMESIGTPIGLEIRDVHYFNDTTALLATYNNGLCLLQNRKIIKLDIKTNKINAASCIIEDEYEELWITSNEGLFRINKSHLLSFIKDQSTYLYFNYFDRSVGASDNEFNGQCDPCANQLDDGRISFPSQKGLNFIDPKFIKESQRSVPKVISTMIVDDKQVTQNMEILLKPKFLKIEFEIAIPHHFRYENAHIYYKLVH